jgi:hypothetical protein
MVQPPLTCLLHPAAALLLPPSHPPSQHLLRRQTLTDPDKRALYDALVGFSEGAVNPFMDASYPADQVGGGAVQQH